MLTTRGTSQEESGGVLCILRDTVGHATGTEEDDDDWVDVEVSVTLDSVEHIGDTDFKLTLFGCVIYICCVGFASLDVVCDELDDCSWNVCL